MSSPANHASPLPSPPDPDPDRPTRARRSARFDVFVSFDTDHDGELCDRILAQSRMPGSGFVVSGASTRSAATEATRETTRRRIAKADQVIVICGEHTDASVGVFSELRAAQEEEKPYVMLWGRREIMCRKPQGARAAEGMFSWTRQILQDQLALNERKAQEHERTTAVARRLALQKGRPLDREAQPQNES